MFCVVYCFVVNFMLFDLVIFLVICFVCVVSSCIAGCEFEFVFSLFGFELGVGCC